MGTPGAFENVEENKGGEGTPEQAGAALQTPYDAYKTPLKALNSPRKGGEAGATSTTRKMTLNDLERQLKETQQENFDLKMRLYYMQEQQRATPAGFRRTQQEEDLQEQAFQLNAMVEEKDIELEAARGNIADLNKQVIENASVYRKEISRLQEQLRVMSMDLTDLTRKYEALLSEHARVKEAEARRAAELEEKLVETQSKEKKAGELVVTCGQQIGSYMQKCRDLEAALGARDKDLERQRDSVKYAELAFKDLQGKYSQALEEIRSKEELKLQLESSEEARKAAIAEGDRLRQDLSAAEQRLKDAHSELAGVRRKAEDVAQMEALEIERLTGLVSQLKEEQRQLEDALIQHAQRGQNAAAEQQRLREELRERMQMQSSAEERLQLDVRKSENRARQVEGERDGLHERVRELDRRYRALEQAHRLTQDAQGRLHEELGRERALSSSLRATIENIGASMPPSPPAHAYRRMAPPPPPTSQPPRSQSHPRERPDRSRGLSRSPSPDPQRRRSQSTGRPPFKAGSVLAATARRGEQRGRSKTPEYQRRSDRRGEDYPRPWLQPGSAMPTRSRRSFHMSDDDNGFNYEHDEYAEPLARTHPPASSSRYGGGGVERGAHSHSHSHSQHAALYRRERGRGEQTLDAYLAEDDTPPLPDPLPCLASPEEIVKAFRSARQASARSPNRADFLSECLKMISIEEREKAQRSTEASRAPAIDPRNMEACLAPIVEKIAALNLPLKMDEVMSQLKKGLTNPNSNSNLAPNPAGSTAMAAAEEIAEEVLARSFGRWSASHPLHA